MPTPDLTNMTMEQIEAYREELSQQYEAIRSEMARTAQALEAHYRAANKARLQAEVERLQAQLEE